MILLRLQSTERMCPLTIHPSMMHQSSVVWEVSGFANGSTKTVPLGALPLPSARLKRAKRARKMVIKITHTVLNASCTSRAAKIVKIIKNAQSTMMLRKSMSSITSHKDFH